MADRPRILQDQRDLLLTLIPLILAALVVAVVAGRCGVDTTHGAAGRPDYDAGAALRLDAREFSFPVREPRLPDGWKPSSGGREKISGDEGGQVSSVGYLSPTGRYLKLSQSSASELALVSRTVGRRAATGAEQLSGRTWVVYAEEGKEAAWVADFGAVRALITGAGTHEQFTALARAVVAAAPLPRVPA